MEHQKKKFSPKKTPQMKRRMQPMQILAKFFFYPLCLFSFLLVLHVMYNDFHHFSMSMLIFIENNKRNEHGGSFLEKNFKIFAFLHLVFYV